MSHKDTTGKPKLRLIPYDCLAEVAKVREFGNNKYGEEHGWRDVDSLDFADAALRHIYKYLYQSDKDSESGLQHLAHAATSILLALQIDIENDRSNSLKTELDNLEYHEVDLGTLLGEDIDEDKLRNYVLGKQYEAANDELPEDML
jgi:hypothetical protein